MAPDEASVFRLCVQAASDVLGATHASILVADPASGTLSIAASSGLSPDTVQRFRLERGQGLAGRALRLKRLVEGRPSRDAAFLEFGWQPDRLGPTLCIPMFVRGEPLGVLSIGRKARRFAEAQKQLAQVLANLTVAAVENARLLAESRRSLARLSAVLELARSFQSMVGLQETLHRVVEEAVHVASGAEAGTLMLVEPDGKLAVRAQVGYETGSLDELRLGPGEGYAGHVLQTRRPMRFTMLDRSALREAVVRQCGETSRMASVKSAVGVPVMLGGRILGVLGVESLSSDAAFGEGDVEILTGLGSHAAIALERARLYEQRRELYLSGIRTLVAAIDARDPTARGHSDRVAFYARRVAEALGMDRAQVEKVELAALLHDVGKIGVADAVLRKPGPLEPAERAVMMAHVELGARILSSNQSLRDLVPLVRHHHEWYSGGGYPDGLKGDAIPLGAAIISVADAFDTMTTGRPYREASLLDEAVAEVRRCSGTQFHPQAADALCQALEEDERSGKAYVFQLRGWLRETGASERPSPGSSGAGALGEDGAADKAAALPLARDVVPLKGGRIIEPAATQVGRITPLETKELSTLYRIAQVFRDVLDLPTMLHHVLTIIEAELAYRDCCIFMQDPSGAELTMVAASGAFAGLEGVRLKKDQGVNGWVATHGLPVLVPDVSQEPRYHPGPPTTRSEVVVPMSAGNRVIGTLCIDSNRLDAFSVDEVQLLSAVAQQAAVAVEVAQLHEQARRAATKDSLTDLFNHRHFYERLEEELERAGRYGYGVQVALGDVDRLKEINDSLGHMAGDGILVELARLFREHSRRYDVLARYGGDEFAIIMPQADRQGARAVLDRLSRAIEGAKFHWYGVNLELPRVSWGLAGFPEDGKRATELVAAADARMYAAKRGAAGVQPVGALSRKRRAPSTGTRVDSGASAGRR